MNTADMHAEAARAAQGDVQLPDGERLHLRLLRADDAAPLGRYFLGLSAATKGFYGPHPFDQPTADALCAEVGTGRTLRLLALTTGDRPEVVGYFLLHVGGRPSDTARYAALGIALDPETDGALAPSVADAYQNRGLGPLMAARLWQVARRLGLRRVVLWDGVMQSNPRGVHFYTKVGFRKQGEFGEETRSYDMLLELPPA